MNKNLIIAIIFVVIAGVGGFFAGTKYQQSQRSTFSRQGNSVQQQNRTRMGGGQVMGEIISADDKSVTVKLQDGSSKIVLITSTTAINKASEGTKNDLKVGERVGVFGTTNSDGTVTAQNVQLNPTFRREAGSGTPRP